MKKDKKKEIAREKIEEKDKIEKETKKEIVKEKTEGKDKKIDKEKGDKEER